MVWYRKIRIEENGCWTWLGALTNGYGMSHIKGKRIRAHRHVYEVLRRTKLGDLTLHHTCTSKACVNPWHMVPMERSAHVKMHKEEYRARTHCKYGHEFTEENTYWKSATDKRCKACSRRHSKQYRQKP